MKKILVPIDLTQVSQNALLYAYEAFPDAQFIVCHVFSGLYSNHRAFIKAGKTKEMFVHDEVRNLCQEALNMNELDERVVIDIREGNPIKEITKAGHEYGVSQIVMGSRDKYSLMEKLTGTISLGVIKETYIPVCLIPIQCRYRTYKHVLVGLDCEVDEELIELVNDWNKDYQAFIRFEHIDEHFSLSNSEKEELLEGLVDQMEGTSGYELNVIRGSHPSRMVIERARTMSVDIIISFPKRDSMLKTLFTGSMAKELMLHADIPLLFL